MDSNLILLAEQDDGLGLVGRDFVGTKVGLLDRKKLGKRLITSTPRVSPISDVSWRILSEESSS